MTVDPRPPHGTPAPAPEGRLTAWSDAAAGSCFEVRRLADGRVAMRRSADPGGPELVFPADEMARFVSGVKAGAADFLL
ncbi:DUF397 domain-containing protein [Streptomyces sp. NPDC023723]|uniref:DUF397 domain-containing protein n=1 Tax=Streptomyces sp. NPDC023723 TaxID=3154323 RepID=UPI0033D4ED6A